MVPLPRVCSMSSTPHSLRLDALLPFGSSSAFDSSVPPSRTATESAPALPGVPQPIPDGATPSRPNVPLKVGRYRVLRFLGAGGMGEVYSAWDPHLERRVAVKWLNRPPKDREAAHPLLREAQAMARVSHPNVVAVYDVGEADGRVFIAMEYVSGSTLRRSLSGLSTEAIVAAYVDAGCGLAAVHEGGLVHRDFKPENVLRGKDGRVRVLDFGITVHASICGITSAGTLEYMAPEQFSSKTSDARSDQFSFCVALYEALEGKRPFTGASAPTIIASVCKDPPRPFNRVSAPHVRAAIERGLSKAPDDRFPSMRALVEALQTPDLAPPEPKHWLWLGGVGLVMGGVVLAATRSAGPCDPSNAPSTETWTSQRAEAVREAFAKTRLPFARRSADDVIGSLDAYASSWSGEWAAVCEATRNAVGTERMLDRSRVCLERGRSHLASLVAELVQPEPMTVERAGRAAAALPDVARCRNVAALDELAPLPPRESDRADVARAMSAVDEATTLIELGRPQDADELLRTAASVVDHVSHGPLHAELARARGRAARVDHDLHRARTWLEEAYYAAYAAQDRGLEADVAVRLATLIGRDLDEPTHGRAWLRHAEAAVAVVGTPRRERVELALASAILDDAHGQTTRGLETVERALSTMQPDEDQRDRLLRSRGSMLRRAGRFGEALSVQQERLRHASQRLGPEHPEAVRLLVEIAAIHYGTRALDDARTLLDEAMELHLRAGGERSLDLANARQLLAAIEVEHGNFEEATRLIRRVVSVRRRRLGEAHDGTLGALNTLGALYTMRGEPERAIEIHTRALKLHEETDGADSLGAAEMLINLANALDEVDRLDEAIVSLERACEVFATRRGGEHPQTAMCRHNLGNQLARAGRPSEALVELDAALHVWSETFDAGDPRSCSTSRVRASTLLALERVEEAGAAADFSWTCDLRQPRPSSVALMADAELQIEAHLRRDDASAAWAHLETMQAHATPEQALELQLMRVRIHARSGHVPDAARTLDAMTPQSDDERARISQTRDALGL